MTAGLSRLRLPAWKAALLSAIVAAQTCTMQACAQAVAEQAGASIYRDGILPSGQPLTARREPDMQISAADAACSNCHRRSGFGDIEGRIGIPPVTGAYLFAPREPERDTRRLPAVGALHSARDAYTDDTLARAIREGVAADGHQLNYLMPHYALSDADMATLIEYLRVMTPAKSPGADTVLHFATIVTPDADPVQRRGMLDVLEHFFADKSAAALSHGPDPRFSHDTLIKTNRRWQLHVWELNGAPTRWEEQLRTRLMHEPVLAVISGLGGTTWAPIHRFCEQAALPCLFPNVDLPVVAEHDYYSLYFSRGVLLEADLIARRVMDEREPPARRIVQIFRQGDIGQAAAAALSAAATGALVLDRPLGVGNVKRQLASALRGVNAGDMLVLWLRPSDLTALASLPAVKSKLFISGLMGGLGSAPVAASWRSVTTMTYPFDLPDNRVIRTDYPLGWFRIKQITVVDERVQTDTWLACNFLSETLDHIGNTLVRDYLVDTLEGMLDHRLLTGYYPRLSLAPNQRFASKGGYLVKFTELGGKRLTAVSDWIVP